MEFLFMLQFNNTVELLPENKTRYKRLITEPLTLLFNELAPAALSISPGIEAKPSRCISTMYNDMRFSKGAPLKTYMYVRFRETCSENDVLGLFFDMGCEDYSYGLRIYNQTAAGMRAVREAALKNERQYSEALSKLISSGAFIAGESFAKDHYPNMYDKVLKELLNRKGFHICHKKLVSGSVFGSKLADEISAGFCGMKDIYVLLKSALYGRNEALKEV